MTDDWTQAWRTATVTGSQVTSEVFFNYNAKADPDTVRDIAGRFPPFTAATNTCR